MRQDCYFGADCGTDFTPPKVRDGDVKRFSMVVMTHKSMRIAYLVAQYPTVSHTFVLREVAALRALGLDIVTCSIRRTPPEQHRGPEEKAEARATFNVLAAAKKPRRMLAAQIAALKKPGLYFRTLAHSWKMRGPGWRAALYQLIYFTEAVVLADHLKAQGVTHVHNHFAQGSCTVALLTARLAEIPFSFTLHGPVDFDDQQLWRLDAKIADANFVSCISHYCRSQGMLVSPAEHWSKMHIVHCGVDLSRYTAKTKPGKEILFVGRLAAEKGVPILIDVLPQIRAKHPDLHVTLIGDGPDRVELENNTRKAGLTDAITFAGYKSQDEVAEALAETNLFVLPSFAEGVPVVLMEAMATQKTVVTTRIAGIPELVEDGVSGRVVSPGDGNALAQAIIEILDQPDSAHKMGAEGRKKVEAEFDIAKEARKLADLFNSA